MSDGWNPLYPSNEEVNSLEEAAREAEWEDSMGELSRGRRRKQQLMNDDDSSEDLFL